MIDIKWEMTINDSRTWTARFGHGTLVRHDSESIDTRGDRNVVAESMVYVPDPPADVAELVDALVTIRRLCETPTGDISVGELEMRIADRVDAALNQVLS